jgi:hypothetical protein
MTKPMTQLGASTSTVAVGAIALSELLGGGTATYILSTFSEEGLNDETGMMINSIFNASSITALVDSLEDGDMTLMYDVYKDDDGQTISVYSAVGQSGPSFSSTET